MEGNLKLQEDSYGASENALNLTESDWVFKISDVHIPGGEENVLGRGSYGEVRVALWRGLRVAAKRLHASSLPGSQEEGEGDRRQATQDFLKEMQLLSKLRHPNLVLFLGVCIDQHNPASCVILTELLPYSIYDMLEKQKLKLNSSEILDISHDIAFGLAYLHNHQPAVVHRDISSKNVLYDGRVAKIADLGQAKVFSSTNNSRNTQTAMPGAMVYSAPEVLTGKYSSKIDVFSFGVLFAQLCTGDYPRIERRQQQIDDAARKFTSMRNLLHRCLSLHPDMRPTAPEIQRGIGALKEDLRIYTPSPSRAGIVAERWFRTKLKESNRDAETRAIVMEKRLEAELGRWRKEADARDELSQKLKETEDLLRGALDNINKEKSIAEDFRRRADESEKKKKEAEDEVDKIYQSLRESQRELEATQQELALEHRRVESAMRLKECAEQNETRAVKAAEKALADQDAAERAASESRKEAETQVLRNKELEEQVLAVIARWEKEKVDRLALKSQFTERGKELQELKQSHDEALKALELAQSRLSDYNSLEAGERMNRRLLDAQQDRDKALEQNRSMQNQIQELESNQTDLVFKVTLLTEQLEQTETYCAETRKRNEDLELQKALWDSSKTSQTEIQNKLEEKLKRRKEKYDIVLEENKRLQRELDSFKAEAPWLFQKGANAACFDTSSTGSVQSELPPLSDPKQALLEAKERGLTAVLSLMKQYPKDPNLQWRSVKLIREVAFQGDEERCEIGTNGGVEVVANAMISHPEHQVLQNNGVRCLANLAFGNDYNRVEIGVRGGITALLTAMQTFPLDALIQGQGCTAITNLSHNCEKNRSLICEAKGVDIILDAMQNFPGDAKLQRQACWALLTLAGSDSVCTHIADRGGVGAILTAMTNCRKDAAVQHFGCWALANIAWGRADVQEFIRKEGAVEVIRTAIASFPSNREVLEKAHLAIDQLKGLN